MTTSAQAEGVIEGVYTDYEVKGGWETSFRYSRFNAALGAAHNPSAAACGGSLVASTEDPHHAASGVAQ